MKSLISSREGPLFHSANHSPGRSYRISTPVAVCLDRSRAVPVPGGSGRSSLSPRPGWVRRGGSGAGWG